MKDRGLLKDTICKEINVREFYKKVRVNRTINEVWDKIRTIKYSQTIDTESELIQCRITRD